MSISSHYLWPLRQTMRLACVCPQVLSGPDRCRTQSLHWLIPPLEIHSVVLENVETMLLNLSRFKHSGVRGGKSSKTITFYNISFYKTKAGKLQQAALRERAYNNRLTGHHLCRSNFITWTKRQRLKCFVTRIKVTAIKKATSSISISCYPTPNLFYETQNLSSNQRNLQFPKDCTIRVL